MSKETRTIRPFVGIDDLARTLDEAAIYVGQESCAANEGLTVDLPPHELLLRPISIQWASDDQALEGFKTRISDGAKAADVALKDLSLVVVASSQFLKFADVVFDFSLADLANIPRLVHLTEEVRAPAFSAPFSGFTADAYVVLSRALRPKPLRPYRRGTWLAWSHFRVESSHAPALLPPTPLTDEVRTRYRLGAKTIRYLYFGDHDVIEPYTQQERPIFYIDEKLLAQMSARRRSAASRALQLQLAQDFATAVIRRAAPSQKLTEVSYEDVRGSLLGSVIRIAAGPGATDDDRSRLLDEVRNDPEYVVARAEHVIDVGSGFGSILAGDDA